jgi:hypothetical protein
MSEMIQDYNKGTYICDDTSCGYDGDKYLKANSNKGKAFALAKHISMNIILLHDEDCSQEKGPCCEPYMKVLRKRFSERLKLKKAFQDVSFTVMELPGGHKISFLN